MDAALDDIRFLADSENRFTALERLSDGPHTRSDLREATDASAATISRLLGDFERCGWVTRDGRQYTLTPLGQYVGRAFIDLYGHMKTANTLRDLLPWFPLDDLDFAVDPTVLTEATITAATPDNPLAPVARVLEIERESAWTRTLADRLPEACLKARHDAVVDGTQTCELVTTPGVIESVMESSAAEYFEEIVAADGTVVYVYDGDLEPGGIYDGTAYRIVADGRDVNVGVIESDDPAFVERLTASFEECRNEATRLTTASLERGIDSLGVEQ